MIKNALVEQPLGFCNVMADNGKEVVWDQTQQVWLSCEENLVETVVNYWD